MDDLHGITESNGQNLTLSPNNTFELTYHYFYESEDSHYKVTSFTDYDLNIKGSVTEETASVWICHITEGKYKDHNLKGKYSGDQLKGRFKITAKPERVIMISEVLINKKDGLPCKYGMSRLEGTKMQRKKE